MLFSRSKSSASLPGNLLYPLAWTGHVVPAYPGDDQEWLEAEREFLEDAVPVHLTGDRIRRLHHSRGCRASRRDSPTTLRHPRWASVRYTKAMTGSVR